MACVSGITPLQISFSWNYYILRLGDLIRTYSTNRSLFIDRDFFYELIRCTDSKKYLKINAFLESYDSMVCIERNNLEVTITQKSIENFFIEKK